MAHWSLRPIPIPEVPRLTSNDVTVVIPSLCDGDDLNLLGTLRSILVTEPFKIILVTIDQNVERAKRLVKGLEAPNIQVLSIHQANKRRQMVRALPEICTDVTIFADDDVTWPRTLLPWMLAPLEDEAYGGVGTNQRLRRSEKPNLQQRMWEYLGNLYLLRRNFDCAACNYIDGGVPCLSGRTVAYRTQILCEDSFIWDFTHEEWQREYQLNADDDNFITRWLVSRKYKIAFQYHREAEVLTTLEDNPKFLKQCLRWSRSNWRSNITSMFVERHIWRSVLQDLICVRDADWSRQQPWSTYAVHQTTLTQWAILWDVLLLYFCPKEPIALSILLTILILSKFIKFVDHYVRYPGDILLLPVSILFGYFHGGIKFHAACTLHVVSLHFHKLRLPLTFVALLGRMICRPSTMYLRTAGNG